MQLYVVENLLSIKCGISASFLLSCLQTDLWEHVNRAAKEQAEKVVLAVCVLERIDEI